MAKPKPKLQVVEVEDADLIETGEEINLALERLYADADATPDDATAHVYLVEADGTEPKIWKGNAANYDLDALARKHGSGNYRLKVYVPTERGNVGCKINKVIPYRLSAEEDARLRAIRSGEMPATQVNGAQAFSLESIVAAVKAAIPAPAPVAQNNLGMLKEVAEIVRMLAPQPAAPVQQAMPFNPFELMRAAADLTRGRDDSDGDVPRGKSTTTDVFMKLIDKFAPAYMAAMSQQPNALPAPADGAAVNATAVASQSKSPEEDAMIKLRMGISFLIMQAKADSDPETYADVVLDNVPADDLRKVIASNPDPVAYLAQFDKKVLEHRQWFNDLLAAVKEELDAPAANNGSVDESTQTH